MGPFVGNSQTDGCYSAGRFGVSQDYAHDFGLYAQDMACFLVDMLAFKKFS